MQIASNFFYTKISVSSNAGDEFTLRMVNIKVVKLIKFLEIDACLIINVKTKCIVMLNISSKIRAFLDDISYKFKFISAT